MEKAELIWMNGEFVPWDDAKVHVLSHGLHYGTGVFEGIRCYETERGPAIFRHADHLDRLAKSAELYYLRAALLDRGDRRGDARADPPQRAAQLLHPPARLPRLRRDGPLRAERADRGDRSPSGPGAPTSARRARSTASAPRSRRWRRICPGGLIPHAKASGQYLNSILAKTESANAGYEEAILLDERGFVCEGSGENIFLVRDGELVTPPHVASILDGINRKSVIQIARDLGYTVVERDVARAELYLAEEVFLTGTAAELVPVREIDDHRDRRAGRDHPPRPGQVRRRALRPRRGVPGVARLRRGRRPEADEPSKVSS